MFSRNSYHPARVPIKIEPCAAVLSLLIRPLNFFLKSSSSLSPSMNQRVAILFSSLSLRSRGQGAQYALVRLENLAAGPFKQRRICHGPQDLLVIVRIFACGVIVCLLKKRLDTFSSIVNGLYIITGRRAVDDLLFIKEYPEHFFTDQMNIMWESIADLTNPHGCVAANFHSESLRGGRNNFHSGAIIEPLQSYVLQVSYYRIVHGK